MAIDINNIVALSQSVEVESETDGMTAYAVYTLTKEVFASLGLVWTNSRGNEQTSQALYNDARSGKIDGVKGGGNRRYQESDVEQYIARLVAKQTRRA